jgi:methionine-rich copper-binding protein CopC
MTTTSLGTAPRVRRVLLALLAALIAIPLGLMSAAPAQAHSKLVSSNPANAASLAVAPTQVVLTFDETPTVTSVRAQDTDGALVQLGAPVVTPNTVTVAWPASAQPGLYRLVYSLVSDDGDPVQGTLIFTYAALNPAAAPAAPATSANDAEAESEAAIVLTWFAGVALVTLAAFGVLVMSRRRRRTTAGPTLEQIVNQRVDV